MKTFKFFIILILLTYCPDLTADSIDYEHISTDSLEALLLNSNDTYQQINVKNELAFRIHNNDKVRATKLAKSAKLLSSIKDYVKGEASSLIVLGLLSKKSGNPIEAEGYFLKAIEIRRTCCTIEELASALRNLGDLYKSLGEFQKSKKNLEEAIQLISNSKALSLNSKIINTTADLYAKMGNQIKAFKLLEESSVLIQQDQNQLNRANLLLDLGTFYLRLDNWQKVEECYQEARDLYKQENDLTGLGKCYINFSAYHLDYGEYEPALQHLKNALTLKSYLSSTDIAIIFNNIALCYQRLNNWDELERLYEKSYSSFLQIGNKAKAALTAFNSGVYYFDRNEYGMSLKFLLKADSLSEYFDDFYLKGQLFQQLSKVYNQIGQAGPAYSYLDRYNSLRDSLNQNHIAVINYDRNQQEARKEIVKLAHEASENRRKIQLIIGITLLLLMLCGIGFTNYQKRQQQIIAEYEIDQAYQKIDEMLIEQELDMAKAKLAGRDEEQRRIAKDLHDRLGMMLSTIKLYFDDISGEIKDMKSQSAQQHQKATKLLDEACTEVRKIAHNMNTGILAKFGLIEELKALINTLNDSNQIDAKLFVIGIKGRYDVEWENKIYKVIQELVSNILKHSKAKKVTVQLSKIDEELNILVEDNGVGFDAEIALQKDGMGLRNVTLRVADLNGRFHIDSGKGNGTTVSIDLPISLN